MARVTRLSRASKPSATALKGPHHRHQTTTSKKKPLSQKPQKSPPAAALADKKWTKWSQHASSSPFPDFASPTPAGFQLAHDILEELHGDKVRENFAQDEGPMSDMAYENVMDALVVAALSQATSWSNAKRAMSNMASIYGSTFAYQKIEDGGVEKLQDALRPGGMQNRKAKILMKLLHDVKERHGGWDLQHLVQMEDEDVVKEVMQYWGIGPKCAYCLLSICLKRYRFAVDTHIYRLSGLWGWRPKDANVEDAQAHLNALIPDTIKFPLHYQMIVHGRECSCCRGGGSRDLRACAFQKRFEATKVESPGENTRAPI